MKMNKHQLGISMVEVLVALVISVFLLGGIIQVYVGNKATYSFTDAISRIQENGRFAMDTMTTDLRMAGFFGCAIFDPKDTENIVNNLNPDSTDYDANIHDFILAGVINGTENDGLNGSDSVTLRGSKPSQVNVHPPYNVSNSAMIHVTANNSIQPGDIVMVSNCRGADIFQVTNTTTSTKASQNAVVHNTSAGTPGNYARAAASLGLDRLPPLRDDVRAILQGVPLRLRVLRHRGDERAHSTHQVTGSVDRRIGAIAFAWLAEQRLCRR